MTIVHDARLDDREELAKALAPLVSPLDQASDGDLLVAAWQRWGERSPERLLGDFTFAIWDEARRELFLARDHVGQRVLFSFTSPRLLAFSSEIKALLAIPGVPRRLNPERVADFMVGMAPDRSATFYAGVSRLLAGESVLATEGEVRRRRYFEFTLPERTHRGDPDEVAGGFRKVFTAAVRDRLRAAQGVGFTLSGGFDSSSIVSIARTLAHGSREAPLTTFSWYFSQTAVSDERAYFQAVVAQGGLDPHVFDADALSPLAHIDEILAAVDEPFDGPHVPYRWAVARLAAELGIGVVLEGNGGDAVSPTGLHFLADLARHGHLVRLAREIRGLARTLQVPPGRAVRQLVLAPNVPDFIRRLRRAVMGRTARYPAPPFVAPELARRTSLDQRLEAFWHRRPSPRNEREHHLRDLVDHLPGNVFELTYASFAVEPRFPFTDRRVIEYCLAVPSAHKIENGMTRMLTRRAFAGLLPPAITARTRKANASPSFTRRLFEVDRPLVEDALSAPAGAQGRSYLDFSALRDAYERCASWSRSHPGEQPPLPLWRQIDQLRKAVVLVRWLRNTGIEE